MNPNLKNNFKEITFKLNDDFKKMNFSIKDDFKELMSRSNYDFEKIGNGQYGDVYCLINKETGEKYAVKLMKRNNEDPEISTSSFVNEINTLGQLCHPTILTLYDYQEQSNIYMIFTEYANHGDLS